MKIRRLLLLLVAFSCLARPVPLAAAAAVHTVQVEATITSSAQWLPVGDEEGHVIGLAKGEGQAVLSSGETAKYANVSTFDSRRGQGGFSEGYTRFTFADGSEIFFYWTARISAGQNGLSTSSGEGVIVKGSGRFAGIEGTSAFTSRVELRDAQRVTVATATLTYTLP